MVSQPDQEGRGVRETAMERAANLRQERVVSRGLVGGGEGLPGGARWW